MKRYVILLLGICGLVISDATLNDDINDLVALFPTDSTISDIIVTYLTSDEDVEKTIEYIRSSDVESSLDSVSNLRELEAVKKFVEDAGLESSVAINAMSRVLGMSNLIVARSSPEKTSEVIISGGFEGFFRDILAAFPTESIAALLQKKLISSPFFATFVEKITSQEFQGLVTALQATNECQELFKLLSRRVNLSHFVNLFASAIGLGPNGVAYSALRPSENSNDFSHPNSSSDENVTKLDEKYHAVGSVIRRMMRYLKSDEFNQLLSSLEKTEEYVALEKYFRGAGFDLKSTYRKLCRTFLQHALSIGYGNAESNSNVAITEGLRGSFADYRDRKASEKNAALNRKKRADSEAFDTFVERIKSNDFVAIRDALRTTEALEKIKQKLLSLGDSRKDYISLLNELAGIYADENIVNEEHK